MKKTVAIILIFLIFVQTSAFAYTSYDELKSQRSDLEKQSKSFWDNCNACEAYLEAAASQDMDKWEEARKRLPPSVSIGLKDAEDEIEYVEQCKNTWQYLAETTDIKIELIDIKKQLYFDVFVAKTKTPLDAAKENGYPICPSGEDNYWFLNARRMFALDFGIGFKTLHPAVSTIYLLIGEVTSKSDNEFEMICDGVTVKVLLKNEEGIEYTVPSVGEYINVFGTLFAFNEETAVFVAYGKEESIDIDKISRIYYDRKNVE